MPWINQYRIGAVEIALTEDRYREYAKEANFPAFLSLQSVNPDVTFQVRDGAYLRETERPPFFDSESGWRLYQNGKRWVTWVGPQGGEPCLVADTSGSFESGIIYTYKNQIESSQWNFPLGYPLGKIFLMNYLVAGHGIMLHACGLSVRGKGYLFSGVSGSGKSTTARLWKNLPDVQILGDDMIILRKIEGQYRIFSTPWYTGLPASQVDGVPVERIFILQHANSNQIRSLSPSQATAELIVRSFSPLWSMEGMAFTIQFLADVQKSLPVHELGFLPDRSAVEFVQCICAP